MRAGPATILVFTKLGRALSADEESDLVSKLNAVAPTMSVDPRGNRIWSGTKSGFVKMEAGRTRAGTVVERGLPLKDEVWAGELERALLALDDSVRLSGQSFLVKLPS